MDSIGKFVNFHLIDGKAYTEDNVLVYNVFVYNVPKKTSNYEFFKYFEKFGDLASVHLLNVRNEKVHNRKPKIGFANFKEPESAAKVLSKTDHIIKGVQIYVKACHSWHQPDAEPAASSESAEDDVDENATSLLMLNDDCLDAIFQHMQIGEQVNLARCCCRLRDVFVRRAKVTYKTLDLESLDCLTLWQTRNFLQMAGPYIEKLHSLSPSHHYKTVIEFIGIYCANLKSISMGRQHLSANSLQKLLRNTHRVEELWLEDVELKDKSIPELKKLKKLKKLSLDRNHALTGREIKTLATVQELSLNGCQAVAPIYFKRICENLKDLKYLDIQDCSSLKAFSMLNIVTHLHKLETIKLSYVNSQIGCIAALPSLKSLYLGGGSRYGTMPPHIFTELVKYKTEQLELLSIPYRNAMDVEKVVCIGELKKLRELTCPNNDTINDTCMEHLTNLENLEFLDISNCNGFTPRALLDLIQNCRKLKTLNVSHCRQLDEKFAMKLLGLLISEKKLRDQDRPLKVIASGSGMEGVAVRSSVFEEATDILVVTFGYNKIQYDYVDDFSDLEDSDIDDYFYVQEDDDDYYSYMYFSDPDDIDDDDLNVMAFSDMRRAALGNY